VKDYAFCFVFQMKGGLDWGKGVWMRGQCIGKRKEGAPGESLGRRKEREKNMEI